MSSRTSWACWALSFSQEKDRAIAETLGRPVSPQSGRSPLARGVDLLDHPDHVQGVRGQTGATSIGDIDMGVSSTVFPMHGWDLYDDRAAVVGTETATALITGRRDLEQYEKLFAKLATLASTGAGLSRSLDRIRADYSALTRRKPPGLTGSGQQVQRPELIHADDPPVLGWVVVEVQDPAHLRRWRPGRWR